MQITIIIISVILLLLIVNEIINYSVYGKFCRYREETLLFFLPIHCKMWISSISPTTICTMSKTDNKDYREFVIYTTRASLLCSYWVCIDGKHYQVLKGSFSNKLIKQYFKQLQTAQTI